MIVSKTETKKKTFWCWEHKLTIRAQHSLFCLLVFLSVVPKMEVTKYKSNAKHATFERLDTANEVTHCQGVDSRLRFNVSRVISVNVSKYRVYHHIHTQSWSCSMWLINSWHLFIFYFFFFALGICWKQLCTGRSKHPNGWTIKLRCGKMWWSVTKCNVNIGPCVLNYIYIIVISWNYTIIKMLFYSILVLGLLSDSLQYSFCFYRRLLGAVSKLLKPYFHVKQCIIVLELW